MGASTSLTSFFPITTSHYFIYVQSLSHYSIYVQSLLYLRSLPTLSTFTLYSIYVQSLLYLLVTPYSIYVHPLLYLRSPSTLFTFSHYSIYVHSLRYLRSVITLSTFTPSLATCIPSSLPVSSCLLPYMRHVRKTGTNLTHLRLRVAIQGIV